MHGVHGDNFINISWAWTLPGYRKLGIAGYLIQAAEFLAAENTAFFKRTPGAVVASGKEKAEYLTGIIKTI